MDLWKRFYQRMLEILGAGALVAFLFSCGMPDKFDERFYQLTIILGIFASVMCFLAYDLGFFTHHIWVKRAISWTLTMLFALFLLWVMDYFGDTVSWEKLVKTFLTMFITGGAVSTVLFLVSDAAERRKLRRINERLREKNGDENEDE